MNLPMNLLQTPTRDELLLAYRSKGPLAEAGDRTVHVLVVSRGNYVADDGNGTLFSRIDMNGDTFSP